MAIAARARAAARRPVPMRALKAVVVQVAGIALATVVLLEGVVALSFAFPAASPIPLPLLRTMYQHFDRNVIQAMPACARHDDRVTYTLRPGICTFSNREFSTTYRVNSLGVRDDEASLQAPEIVVLGDSLAMGWGVEQDQAFPAVLERLTGRRVLNAGISSFGTVRELRLLERIDRSRLAQLVIQYSANDAQENEAFVAAGDLRTLNADEYRRTVDQQQRALRYVPGKYALNVLVQLQAAVRRRLTASEPGSATADRWKREAIVFIDVLKQSPVDLSSVAITVTALDSPFIEALKREATRSDVPWIAALRAVDAGAATGFPGAFFVLDDHPTAAGQEAIARVLAESLAAARPR